MPSISIPTSAAIIGAGALGAGASIASSAIGADAATSAAQTQADAATSSAQLLNQQYQTTRADLAPWRTAGQGALGALTSLTGTGAGGNPLTAPLTKPFNPTMESLAATPGYQFTLNQGNLAVKNAFSAQGLGGGVDQAGNATTSGPLGKGLVNYAEGLAGTTFQQQFNNYLAQNQQIYNMLSGISGSGQNAAALTGSLGAANANSVAGLLTGGAAATAGGTVGAANAITGGLGSLAGTGQNTAMLLALQNAGLFGSPTQTPSANPFAVPYNTSGGSAGSNFVPENALVS